MRSTFRGRIQIRYLEVCDTGANMAGTTGLEPTASAVTGGPSVGGARRINRLGVRLSATAGFIGQCRLGFVQRFCSTSSHSLAMQQPVFRVISESAPRGATLIVSLHKFPLLLLVYRSAAHFVALRIRPAGGDRASFAVSRQDDAGSGGNFAILLLSGCQRMVIDLLY